MNVAYVITMNGGQATPAVAGSKLADSAATSLNPLFALQLGALLQSMQTPQPAEEAQMLQGEDTLDGTAETLLQLLDQLLAEGLLTPEQHEQFTASLEAGQTAHRGTQHSDLLPSAVAVQEHRHLVATFMQLGLAKEQAAALADVLADVSQSDQSVQQTVRRPIAEAVDSLLNKSLNAALAARPALAADDSQPQKGMKPQTAATSLPHGEAGAENRARMALVNQTMQPLRLHQALASYQAESGTASRSQRIPVQQLAAAASQVQPVADEPGSVNHAPAVQSVPIGQPQWLSQPQTAQSGSYPVQSQHFPEQVSHLFVKQLKLTETNGISEAKLVLYPRSLGQIDVKISAQNGVITAYFTADTASGKELLDTQLAQLRTALIQQGLQVDRLEVTHQPSVQQQAFGFQQQREQGRQQQHRQQADSFSAADEQAEFSLEALTEQSASLTALWERARLAGNRLYSAYA
ncbi:flagellar hook-length control protein FliK [Brevibacillus marinus]|uniref:flagellar hook-length control protein FliK n=1 Tax=Brevibacillus marinus TaxID=2496837 RepID=UPI000F84859A|nr:flagellar hook-length control protein FliK [Brevibacillus marinus]